ncbi:MAG: hypothetical protein NTZ97_05080 [Candidatus Moranbacteria bacterium]|nr:hypothetical protein [Candidatus Moranbacteria bacterium]
MTISEIQKKLYNKEADKDLSKIASSQFDPTAVPGAGKEQFTKTDAWQAPEKGLKAEQKKAIKFGAIALGGILLVALIVMGVFYFMQSAFNEDRVKVSISGPETAQSGDILTYEIQYKNNNRAKLSGVVLRVGYPEGFKPEIEQGFRQEGQMAVALDLGEIKGFGSGKITLKGKAYGPKGNLMLLEAGLTYNPASYTNKFVAKGQTGLTIISSPIVVEVMAPLVLASGGAIDYLVDYKNTGSTDYEGVKIKAEYPAGFTFSQSEPKSSEGEGVFYVGHLSAGQEGKLVISGKLEGSRDEIKPIKISVGETSGGIFLVHNDERAETKIVSPTLVISQTVNGVRGVSVNAGDTLLFTITYKNEGNIGLRDVIITEKIDSTVLDYSKMELSSGAFDGNSKTITWKSKDIPNLRFLEAGQGGTIRFDVRVKEIIPVAGASDKNFIISSIAKIDSPDVPAILAGNKVISSNQVDFKLNSKLVLAVKGYYNDTSLPNSGPIPPQVGTDTTYTIHWKIANVSNDITGAKVETVLPTGVVFTGKVYPENTKLTYNDRSGSLIWEIGTMAAGEGVLSPGKEISFQVKVNPAPSQVDTMVDLTGASIFSAKDIFTGSDVSTTTEKKTTFLSEDTKILSNGYKVQAK